MTEDKKKTDPAADYAAARKAADSALAGLGEKKAFSYDPDGDALYRQYRDKYAALGRDAMEDTVGRVSALTGGYANSFAVGAGNQAYANYLRELNDLVPGLEARAYARWKDGNDEEKALYGLLSDAAERAYSRYRDEIADGRYEDETAYRRSRDAASDLRSAYEYGNDLAYRYDSLLASKGYDLRTEEGKKQAEQAAEGGKSSAGDVPAKADTVIAKLGTYLENGQTADAARLIAAYRAMGYTGWADRMEEIYLREKGPDGTAARGASSRSDASAGSLSPDGQQSKEHTVRIETAEERGNDRIPVGKEGTIVSPALGAIAGAANAIQIRKGTEDENSDTDALSALLAAYKAIRNGDGKEERK